MDPAIMAAIIAALSSLFGGSDAPDTSTPADAPAGAGKGGVTPGFALPTPAADTDIGAIIQSQVSAPDPVAAPPTVPLSPPEQAGPPLPPPPQAGPPSPFPPPPPPPIVPPAAQLPASIGEILQASPEALAAVAQLLGLGQQSPTTVRAAPAPSGSTGSIIPGLQLPQSGQLGALLRQIPGLI